MCKLAVSVQTAKWFDETKPADSMRYIKECGFEGVDYNINIPGCGCHWYIYVATQSCAG